MTQNAGEELVLLLQQALGTVNDLMTKMPLLPVFALTQSMQSSGELLFGAPDAEPSVTITLLIRGLQEKAAEGTLRAYALACEIVLTNKETGATEDAVRITMEHRMGNPQACAVTFFRTKEGVTWGRLERLRPEALVFSPRTA